MTHFQLTVVRLSFITFKYLISNYRWIRRFTKQYGYWFEMIERVSSIIRYELNRTEPIRTEPNRPEWKRLKIFFFFFNKKSTHSQYANCQNQLAGVFLAPVCLFFLSKHLHMQRRRMYKKKHHIFHAWWNFEWKKKCFFRYWTKSLTLELTRIHENNEKKNIQVNIHIVSRFAYNIEV